MPKSSHRANSTPKTHATSPDPNNAQAYSGRGGSLGDDYKKGEFATVISYNSDTYSATVRTERGKNIIAQRLRSTPSELQALETGTEVLVSWEYGPPLIMGIVSSPSDKNTGGTPFRITEVTAGGEAFDKDELGSEGNYRNASEPIDMLPGDWANVGEDGNLFARLTGGVNVIKSSPLSQIRTHSINDFVEIISRNFRHISDMGEYSIQNNDGRINMRFRGASDQRNEAGPDEENWTIYFDLGSEGDILNFEITTPQAQTLFRLHVDSDGHCEIYGINGVDINSGARAGGTSAQEQTGNVVRSIGGNKTESIEGDDTRVINGSQSTQVIADHEVSAGNDARLQAFRDVAIGAGRNLNVLVQGPLVPGQDACVFDIESGNWTVDIGGPTSPLSSFSMQTFTGNMDFKSTLGGNFTVETLLGNIQTTSKEFKVVTGLPDSVILGGPVITSHLAKFEELQAYVSALHQALDTHSHLIPGTAQAGPFTVGGATGVPVVPIGPLVAPLVPFIRSLVAGVSS